MELPTLVGAPWDQWVTLEWNIPIVEIDIEAEFERIRGEAINDSFIKGRSYDEVINLVAKKVVPLLTLTYPDQNATSDADEEALRRYKEALGRYDETLNRYGVLRSEIRNMFKPKTSSEDTSKIPLTKTQRIVLGLMEFAGVSRPIRHFPPSPEQ